MIPFHLSNFIHQQRWIRWGLGLMGVFIGLGILILAGRSHPTPPQLSNYALTSQSVFNQLQSYPVQPDPPTPAFRATHPWEGRLILPEPDPAFPGDWVWVEIYQAPAPYRALVGRTLRLQWEASAPIQTYMQALSTDVHLGEAARSFLYRGNILPLRLHDRGEVGPLQSVAGARPLDDVVVSLQEVSVIPTEAADPYLQITQEPLQITGRFYGLVEIVEPVQFQDWQNFLCPALPPCPSPQFWVRPFNTATQTFQGSPFQIQIPQQLPTRTGIFPSTPYQIEASAAGQAGWYIYGAEDVDQNFVVQAIQPRALLQLQPDRIIQGRQASLDYLLRHKWDDVQDRKGTIERVLLDPDPASAAAPLSVWNQGDQALLLHLFGGIGGPRAEGTPFATVPGHFAFGWGNIQQEPLSQELQWDLNYIQVYAHNPQGIIAGPVSWANYMGDLQRGWLGTRPVSDILVNFPPLTQDYDFDGVTLSPMRDLLIQLQGMAARYRTGDGTGVAAVSPATSCVQDSSQALYLTIERVKEQVRSHPQIQAWLQAHPEAAQTQRFAQLVAFSQDLEDLLQPFGQVRRDWQLNAATLVGIGSHTDPLEWVQDADLLSALLSWRTMMPRRAQDELTSLFLVHGAKLWVLKTYQVGGWDASIEPLAPTTLLGQIPLISSLWQRLFLSLTTLPTTQEWLLSLALLILFAGITLPVGVRVGFLFWSPTAIRALPLLFKILASFFIPVLAEELFFRVILIPHPQEMYAPLVWLGWAIFSLAMFMLYHPLQGLTLSRKRRATFSNPMFLTLATGMGIICTIAYGLTGSIWPAILIHWICVLAWLYLLGGEVMLRVTGGQSDT
ncbi:MAG: CPBP family intramembrane metalloprotease [Synechococcaceae cyanobacterium SM2_3_1]|nr:CPBP family intramembrane metalloprotease [Synechococcaceae cyanobacterium SM2_3_1]